MIGVFSKFRAGLRRTAQSISHVTDRMLPSSSLDPGSIDILEEALFDADFDVETAAEIISAIDRESHRKGRIGAKEISQLGIDILSQTLRGAEGRLDTVDITPKVIILMGVNGSGKTTTAAKLGSHFRALGLNPLLAACDTFRAAANEQIGIWAERLDLDLIGSHHGADAAAVAFDAFKAFQSRSRDVLLLDTAGRLHTKSNLMNELVKIRRVLDKQDCDVEQHRWLVVDGTLGSNSVEQARVFNSEIGVTGIVVTKLDGSSRGGALVGIFRELRIPIYYVGLGEEVDDLQEFSVKRYSNAIFGVGDER